MYNYYSNRSSIINLKKSIKKNRIKNNLSKKISFFIFIISFFRYIYLFKLNYIQSINSQINTIQLYNLNNLNNVD